MSYLGLYVKRARARS